MVVSGVLSMPCCGGMDLVVMFSSSSSGIVLVGLSRSSRAVVALVVLSISGCGLFALVGAPSPSCGFGGVGAEFDIPIDKSLNLNSSVGIINTHL